MAMDLRSAGFLLFVFGVFFIVIAGIFPPILDRKIENEQIHNTVLDSSASGRYSSWVDSTNEDASREYLNITIFNITNPLEFINGETLRVQELGPIVYRMHNRKFNIYWSEERDTVTFQEWRYLLFIEEESNFHQDDVFTTINLALHAIRSNAPVGLAETAMSLLYGIDKTDEYRMFRTISTKQLLFGYPDPEMEAASAIVKGAPDHFPGIYLSGNASSIEEAAKKNHYHTIYTGKLNTYRTMEYSMWENEHYISVCSGFENPCPAANLVHPWGTLKANTVRGTEGEQFRRTLQPNDVIPLHEENTNRAWDLKNIDGETVIVKGIKLLRFVIDPRSYLNATEHPPNGDFFMSDPLHPAFPHYPRGVFNISSVTLGLPLYMTFPHFYGGDPALLDKVEGLFPNQDKHQFSIDVEPNTGLSMQVRGRFQLNLLSQPVKHLGGQWFSNVNHALIPIATFDRNGDVTDEEANKFKVLYTAKLIRNIALLGGLSLGVVLSLAGIIMIRVAKNRADRESHSLEAGTEPLLPVTRSQAK